MNVFSVSATAQHPVVRQRAALPSIAMKELTVRHDQFKTAASLHKI